VALGLGIGLAAFYILPVVLEQHWIQSEGAFAAGLNINVNFLFNRSDDADHTKFNMLVSGLACAEMALLAAAGVPALRRARRGNSLRPGTSSCADALCYGLPVLLGLAALFWGLLFRWARPIWLTLPRFWMAQFPWRSLYILNLALAVSFAVAAYASRRKALWLGAAVVLWLVLGGGVLRGAPWQPDDIHELIAAAHSQAGYIGVVDEFLPVGVDPDNLEEDAPLVAVLDSGGEPIAGVEPQIVRWRAEEKVLTVVTDAPARLRLRLVNYRAWNATVNGAWVAPQTDPDTGQMVIPVPAGHSEVCVWFGYTADRPASAAVSLVALAIVVFFALKRSA
jgi:hypothetical protein